MATLTGTGGTDDLTGNRENDSISGLEGDDVLQGRGGNDTLDGGSGNDLMQGNRGNDVYIVDSSGDIVQELSFEGTDLVQSSIYYYTLPSSPSSSVENLLLTGTAEYGSGNSIANQITGTDLQNSLSGQDGNDTLYGLRGNDNLNGDNGNDILNGNQGNDRLYGGNDNDVLNGNQGDDVLYGSSGNDVLNGNEGIDVLSGYDYDFSSSEFDTLTGGSSRDTFVLGAYYCYEYYEGEYYCDYIETFYLGTGHATITDFNRAQGDQIDIAFELNLYTLDTNSNFGGSLKKDTAIYYSGDLIAVVLDETSLTESDFYQLGY